MESRKDFIFESKDCTSAFKHSEAIVQVVSVSLFLNYLIEMPVTLEYHFSL